MTSHRYLPLFLALSGLAGCGQLQALMGGGDTPEVTASADALLAAGDLPGAQAEFAKIRGESPDSVYAAQGEAYARLLAGDYAAADKALEAAATKAKDNGMEQKLIDEIALRRAVVALRAGKLDDVKAHGKASNLPAGQVLAAEVHLADAESEDALKLLKTAASAPGVVGQTAQTYVTMLESDDPINKGLAEATALWALGQRDTAVEAAEELVKALPEDRDGKSELLLLWAGRAVTSGRAGIAQALLDAMGPPPEGHAWRLQATRAMIAIAEGDDESGVAIFTALASADVPADGLADALATAAALTSDPEVATKLAGSLESVAAARGLYQAKAVDAAKQAAPGTAFGKYVEGQ